MMPAITLHRPWPELIARGLKRVETRTHSRFAGLDGRRVAIHAGKAWDADALEYAAEWLGDEEPLAGIAPETCPPGVVCTAEVAEHRRIRPGDSAACLFEVEPADRLYGLFLADVYRLPDRAPAKGAQGVWTWGGAPMRQFGRCELRATYDYAEKADGQALHLWRKGEAYSLLGVDPAIPHISPCFLLHNDFGHLIDMDPRRLRKTARDLGARRIKVSRQGRRGQHVDLCGKPLRLAVALCVAQAACPATAGSRLHRR